MSKFYKLKKDFPGNEDSYNVFHMMVHFIKALDFIISKDVLESMPSSARRFFEEFNDDVKVRFSGPEVLEIDGEKEEKCIEEDAFENDGYNDNPNWEHKEEK